MPHGKSPGASVVLHPLEKPMQNVNKNVNNYISEVSHGMFNLQPFHR